MGNILWETYVLEHLYACSRFKVPPQADSIGKVNITAKLRKKKWKQFTDSGNLKIRRKFKVSSIFTVEFSENIPEFHYFILVWGFSKTYLSAPPN